MAKRTDLSNMTEEQKAEHRRQKQREANRRFREKHKNDNTYKEKVFYTNKKSNAKAFLKEAEEDDFLEHVENVIHEFEDRFGFSINGFAEKFGKIKKEDNKEAPEKPVEELKPLPASPAEEEIVEGFAESESVTLMSHLTQKTNKNL